MKETLAVLFLSLVLKPATAAVLDTGGPSISEAGNSSGSGNEIQNYNTQTAPGVCQLSTCEHLLQQLEALQGQMREMEARLQASEVKIISAEAKAGVMEAKLQNCSNDVEVLKEESRAKYHVAFAAALGDGGYVGPASNEHTLPFRKVLTNVGDAYNPSSGVFLVPVRGVYYVSFSTFTRGNSEVNSCVSLFRDDQRLLTACDHASDDFSDSSGNGATLLLEKDDHVYITLHKRSMVYDDDHNRSCFRAFLIYPM